MADLEDFFAKRDKKKKSKGQKYETVGLDDVAKILDAKVKERKKQETNKSTYQVPISETGDQLPPTDYRAQEDDEWKEHVEQKPDYTGLKIQDLVLEDEDENTTKDTNGQDDGDKPKEGPWRKAHAPTPTAPTTTPVVSTPTPVDVEVDVELNSKEEKESPESRVPLTEDKDKPVSDVETPVGNPDTTGPEAEAEPPKKAAYVPAAVRRAREEAAAKEALASSTPSTISRPTSSSTSSDSTPKLAVSSSGAYVPPWKKGLTSGSSSSSGSKPKKSAAAPNINDEQYFPSLGDTPTGKQS